MGATKYCFGLSAGGRWVRWGPAAGPQAPGASSPEGPGGFTLTGTRVLDGETLSEPEPAFVAGGFAQE